MIERDTSEGLGPIVSSSHLATGEMPALSEFEFGLILAGHAFERWIVRCMAAAGCSGLGPLDILVLHMANHRGRAKTLSDICLVLNIEDTHLVTYAVKKLEASGLVTSGKSGKEKTVEISAKGKAACERYRDVREALLVKSAGGLGYTSEQVSHLATQLRALSGHYDQASRSAASL